MPCVASALVRLLVAMALAAGLGPICFDVLHWVGRSLHRLPADVLASAGGAVIGAVFVCWRRPNWFIHTWIHEHSHLFVYVLLHGRTPRGLQVSDGRGGAIEHVETDPVRGTLVQIAPYTLPLLLLPVLVVRSLFVTEPGPWRHVLSALVAFAFIHHLQALFHNIRLNWRGEDADLVKVGRPLAFVLIAIALMLLSAWVLRALWHGFPSGW